MEDAKNILAMSLVNGTLCIEFQPECSDEMKRDWEALSRIIGESFQVGRAIPLSVILEQFRNYVTTQEALWREDVADDRNPSRTIFLWCSNFLYPVIRSDDAALARAFVKEFITHLVMPDVIPDEQVDILFKGQDTPFKDDYLEVYWDLIRLHPSEPAAPDNT